MGRPNDIMNWAGRQFDSFGPYLSIESGNPEMGMGGANYWTIHGTNDAGNCCSIGQDAGGKLSIINDGSVEINGGGQEDGGGVNITSMKGGISIIVENNGDIKIGNNGKGKIHLKGTDILLEATNDIRIDAGNALNLASNIMNRERAQTGNMCVECFGSLIQKDTLLKATSHNLELADALGDFA